MSEHTSTKPKADPPEHKIGPIGAISIAVWLNTIQTDDGPRSVRSITIAPRRYRDNNSGDWKDTYSYRPGDLPALIFALTKAQEYVFTTPLPGQEPEQEERTF